MVDKAELSCYTPPPMQHHSFYRNLPPLFINIDSCKWNLFEWPSAYPRPVGMWEGRYSPGTTWDTPATHNKVIIWTCTWVDNYENSEIYIEWYNIMFPGKTQPDIRNPTWKQYLFSNNFVVLRFSPMSWTLLWLVRTWLTSQNCIKVFTVFFYFNLQ